MNRINQSFTFWISSDERERERVIELSINVVLTGAGFVLLLVQSHQCQAVDHYLECNDKPSTLCLTQGYSTFELPHRNKPNLIKIGENTANYCKGSILHQKITQWIINNSNDCQ